MGDELLGPGSERFTLASIERCVLDPFTIENLEYDSSGAPIWLSKLPWLNLAGRTMVNASKGKEIYVTIALEGLVHRGGARKFAESCESDHGFCPRIGGARSAWTCIGVLRFQVCADILWQLIQCIRILNVTFGITGKFGESPGDFQDKKKRHECFSAASRMHVRYGMNDLRVLVKRLEEVEKWERDTPPSRGRPHIRGPFGYYANSCSGDPMKHNFSEALRWDVFQKMIEKAQYAFPPFSASHLSDSPEEMLKNLDGAKEREIQRRAEFLKIVFNGLLWNDCCYTVAEFDMRPMLMRVEIKDNCSKIYNMKRTWDFA